MKYVEASKCGIAVGVRSVEAIQAAVAELIASPVRRTEMGLHGRRVAETRHNAEFQRPEFQSALLRAMWHDA